MNVSELIKAYSALQNTNPKYFTYSHEQELNIVSDMLLGLINIKLSEEYNYDDDIEKDLIV